MTTAQSARVSVATYKDLRVEKVDSHTVRVTYPRPTPFWAEAMTGVFGCILPKHVFEPCMGAKSRENPANIKAVGTGPYKLVDFKPGDILRAEANERARKPSYKLWIDFGPLGEKRSSAQIRALYTPEELDRLTAKLEECRFNLLILNNP